MKKKNLSLLEDFYAEHLATINDVKFTKREIDIIACILHGRTAKGSATLLSILPRTAQVHTQNIRNKLGGSSREGIINFIESSEKLPLVRDYYSKLLVECAFDKKLDEISKLKLERNNKLLIVYGVRIKDKKSLFEKLEKNLEKAGLKASVCEYRADPINDEEEVSTQTHIMFAEEEAKNNPSETSPNREYIDLSTCQSYYAVVFEILKRLYPSSEIEKINSTFKEEDNGVNIYFPLKVDQSPPEQPPFSSEERQSKKRNALLWSAALCCLVIGIFFIAFSQTGKEIDQIRSDLVIPTESALLHRPEILKQIDLKLKGKTGIQTVVLVGIGGAGKTTLARQYVHQQKAKVIWELNAETHSSLISSFENLAYSLATTEDDKKSLKAFQEIKNSDQREKSLVQFVKEHLRRNKPWVLIYDNVPKMVDIQNYFPTDSKTWGEGKILLTTQDGTINNNKYIPHIIQVGELSEKQKKDFFTKILYKDKSINQRVLNQATAFLKKIPPFPLDVSVAAYYLRATNLSFEDYLERFNLPSENFDKAQLNLIDESNDYKKTRYSIITLTLQKIINADKDFHDLLLLVCLLDSHNIPRELLDIYKDKITVDRFIHNMKNFSLITDSIVSINSFPQLSIHKSTQKIGFIYFVKTLGLMKDTEKLESITNILEKYLNNINEKRELSKIKKLINHCEEFISHSPPLTEEMKWTITGKLGEMYYLLGYHKKGEWFLNETLKNFDKAYLKNKMKIAPLLHNLGNIYRELGNYEKSKSVLERGLSIYKEEFPQNLLRTAQVLGNLGILHRELGNFEKAKKYLEHSLVLYKKSSSETQPDAALTLTFLGIVHWDLGNYKKASDLLNKSLSIYKQHFPNNYNDMAWILTHLGGIYRDLGYYEKARDFLEDGLNIYRKHFPDNYIAIARILTYLGDVYRDSGQYLNAKKSLEQSLLIYKKYYPENHDGLAWVSNYLGVVYKDLGEYKKALELFNISLSIYKELLGENNIITIRTQVQLGNCYRLLGDHERAVRILERSLSTYKQILGEKHSMAIAWISMHLGNAYRELGNLKKAKKLLINSLSAYKGSYGKAHVRTAEILRCLGQVHILEGNFEDGETFITEAFNIYQKNNHQESYKCLENLADSQIKKLTKITSDRDYQSYGFKAQAIHFLKLALKTAKMNFPPNSPHIKRIQSKLEKLQDEG